MKICAACHKDLPKESYSKKQWKLDESQRRCKVCTANNREIQTYPKKQDNEDTSTEEVIKTLDSLCLENIEDEDLFKQPPNEDCSICFLRLPILHSGWRYQSCCGKVVCSGCSHAPLYDNQGNEVDNKKCPFCRTPNPTTKKESNERDKKRMKFDDPIAIYNIGHNYYFGSEGFKQDYNKALELWHRAGELGYAFAYNNIAYVYATGRGAELDLKKTIYYWKLGAIGGDTLARHNLGANEEETDGNFDRAVKHYMIAAGGGDNKSLETIRLLYSRGQASRDDYTKALQSYQSYLGEIKSPQRDKAAAFDNERYRYY